VGKSTLINTIAGKSAAKTGNKPGVTRGNQWIRLNKNIELLDTPGITWPKFEDEHTGDMIAYIGSINDMIVNTQELALSMGAYLLEHAPDKLESCYGYGSKCGAWELIGCIARTRGCLTKGGELDYEKAETILINDFRSGKLGRITLEWPPEVSS
jgi:ribosome biogenesis GTPase A